MIFSIYSRKRRDRDQKLDAILTQLTQQGKDIKRIMAGVSDITVVVYLRQGVLLSLGHPYEVLWCISQHGSNGTLARACLSILAVFSGRYASASERRRSI